ncbi:hypothetical protein NDU88_003767 [Pleurodeles waltl]|uniref:Uncharacterized protein n=1 Tax=Pleurodeles waltl TaxID=8319 RepID=A0AAV7VI92_PLEWA|nr:hypothetical protein NDU88_003767 [Pleurodeles waltl]
MRRGLYGHMFGGQQKRRSTPCLLGGVDVKCPSVPSGPPKPLPETLRECTSLAVSLGRPVQLWIWCEVKDSTHYNILIRCLQDPTQCVSKKEFVVFIWSVYVSDHHMVPLHVKLQREEPARDLSLNLSHPHREICGQQDRHTPAHRPESEE